jgi:phage shock protein A
MDQKTEDQLSTMRELYESLSLEHDELQRQNMRLLAQNAELRKRYAEAETRRDELEREADQLISSDRAVRRLLVLAEVDEATGVGTGYISTTELRAQLVGIQLEEGDAP